MKSLSDCHSGGIGYMHWDIAVKENRVAQIWGRHQKSQGQKLWTAGLDLQRNCFLTWIILGGFMVNNNRYLFILTIMFLLSTAVEVTRDLLNGVGFERKLSYPDRESCLHSTMYNQELSVQSSPRHVRGKKQPWPGLEWLDTKAIRN